MRRLVIALVIALGVAALPPVASAQEIRIGPDPAGPSPSVGPPPMRRPRPPGHHPRPFFPCCAAYWPAPEPPPPPAPPPIVYVLPPGPPPLVYVPTPRVEPAPEVQLPTGRWERHGNGREYPYTWVWVAATGSPPVSAGLSR